MKLAISKGQLTISASSPDAGSASEDIEVRYGATPIEIGFNSRYLLDIAEQIEGEGAKFTMSDAASPTLIFEGTFTREFADRPPAVPRYDYNQVMYRLDLDEPGLAAARVP